MTRGTGTCVAILMALVVVASAVCSAAPRSRRARDVPRPTGELTRREFIPAYFDGRELTLIEGIWVTDDNEYELAIVENTFGVFPQHDYLGIVTDTRSMWWEIGQVKLMLKSTVSDHVYTITWFDKPSSDATRGQGSSVTMNSDNTVTIWLGNDKVVLLRMYPKRPEAESADFTPETASTGTGFFIAKDVVATNYHLVAGFENVEILWGEAVLEACLLIRDRMNDLALLRVQFAGSELQKSTTAERVAPLPFGDVSAMASGDRVTTVGFPLSQELGRRPRVGEGIVNSTVGFGDDPRMLQISIPVQPGNSGSPLFNARGEVIGIVTATANNQYFVIETGTLPQNLNFAVKANYLNNLIGLLPEEIDLRMGRGDTDIDTSDLMDLVQESVVLVRAW